MDLDSTLPRGAAPLRNEARDPQYARFGRQQVWQPKSGNNRGGAGSGEEGHVDVDNALNPSGSRSLAQVGEHFPPKPAARSTDSNKLPSSDNNTTHTHTNGMTSTTLGIQEDTHNIRKVIVSVPEEELASLRSSCEDKAAVTLLGRVQGKHPGLKALTAWAREKLHPTLVLLSLKTNNTFEITFGSPEGRLHALHQADLVCEGAAIFLSSWRPHFDPKKQKEIARLDHPVWVQIIDLCQMLRTDSYLRNIGNHLGRVISIDNSAAYKAKLSGPRIRLLVQDLNNLPEVVVLPRLDEDDTVEYALEFSGLPNQCGRCRSRDHQVRFCPKRENYKRRDPSNSQPSHQHRRTERPVLQPEPTQGAPETERGETDSMVQAAEAHIQDPTLQTQPVEDIIHNIDIQSVQAIQVEQPEIQVPADSPIPELQPDDVNFPKLPLSAKQKQKLEEPSPIKEPQNNVERPETPHFIWRSKPPNLEHQPEDSEERGIQDKNQDTNKGSNSPHYPIPKPVESTPITRQGYRSGRLADDFWSTLKVPNTPTTNRKNLQVIPILYTEHNRAKAEYLVDHKVTPHQPIAQVHIAELLAGIPWQEAITKQHVVNEAAQALYKVLVFTHKTANPLQKWRNGHWFSSWTGEAEGERTCTLYVCAPIQETKAKPRKGQQFGWRRIPEKMWEKITSHKSEVILDCTHDMAQWQQLIGGSRNAQRKATHPVSNLQNRFSILSEEEPDVSQYTI